MPYNPDEPRDWHGRWTTGGDGGAPPPGKPYAATYAQWGAYFDAQAQHERMKQLAAAADPAVNHDVSPDQGRKIVAEAEKWEKTPYAPASTPNSGPGAERGVGADCSGSVHAIYRGAGLSYPYVPSRVFAGASERGKIPFREIKAADARPGDVVVYSNGHMSVYAGAGDVYSAHRKGISYRRSRESDFGKPDQRRYFRYQDLRKGT